jgi:hypothetical protein
MQGTPARTWLDVLLLSRDVGDILLCVWLAVVAMLGSVVLAVVAWAHLHSSTFRVLSQ